ncbi:hypothetical protein Tco_0201907 [Tanacetum coccineum]
MIQIGHDEELAQKLHAEELAKSTVRQEQEMYDFKKALELQKQLDEREEVMKRSGFIRKQSTKEEKEKKKKKDEESSKQVEEETVQKEDVIPEQVVKESSRKAEGRLKRKASKPREDKDKRQIGLGF